MQARAPSYVPYEVYREAEQWSEEKHEWVDGTVFATAGGTQEHSFLAGAVFSELRVALRGRPCRPLNSDMRVRSEASGNAYYADVVVVCGPGVPHPDDKHTVTNPTVLVEVLSPSTAAYDRGEKFEDYQTLPSLKDYVLVSTGRSHIDHYVRQADDSWLLRSYGPGGVFTLAGCEVSLAVDAIYEGVEATRETAG